MNRALIERNRVMSHLFRSVMASLMWIGVLPALAWSQDKRNIVVMMVDNLGWGELGGYGGGILRGTETPRLDRLATG